MNFLLKLLFALFRSHVPVEDIELNKIQNDANTWVTEVQGKKEEKEMLNKAFDFMEQWWVKLLVILGYLKAMREIPRWLNPPAEESDRDDD